MEYNIRVRQTKKGKSLSQKKKIPELKIKITKDNWLNLLFQKWNLGPPLQSKWLDIS